MNVIRTGHATFAPGTCSICGCAPKDPYRRWIDGKIVEGCVGEAHNGIKAWETSSQSVDWHNRPEAKKIRRENRAILNPVRR